MCDYPQENDNNIETHFLDIEFEDAGKLVFSQKEMLFSLKIPDE